MNASFVLLLIVLRLVIPFGAILLLGEFVQRRNVDYRTKM